MRLFSFILLLEGLTQVALPIQAYRFKRGTLDRKTGTYHYQSVKSLRPPGTIFPKTYSEIFYRELYAYKLGNRPGVTMPDGTRCDILTGTHAIEVGVTLRITS